MLRYFLFVYLLFYSLMGFATNAVDSVGFNKEFLQQDKFNSKQFLVDSSQVEQRYFNKEAIEAYQSDKNFLYDRKPPSASLSQLVLFWIKDFFRRLFGQVDPGEKRFGVVGRIIQVLIYVLAATGLVYLIWYFVKVPVRTVLGKGSSKIGYHVADEDIHQINFAEKIKEALAAKDYRFAIRYAYLSLLKSLSDEDIIHWTNEKTNYDYVNEINETYQLAFGVITGVFEQAWYGYKQATENDFNEINEAIRNFNKERT